MTLQERILMILIVALVAIGLIFFGPDVQSNNEITFDDIEYICADYYE